MAIAGSLTTMKMGALRGQLYVLIKSAGALTGKKITHIPQGVGDKRLRMNHRKLKAKPFRPKRRPIRIQRYYWWCWGDKLLPGKLPERTALGPFDSDGEAHERGFMAYSSTFKVYMLNTRNMARAKTQLKEKDIEEGRNIEEALRRSSHYER